MSKTEPLQSRSEVVAALRKHVNDTLDRDFLQRHGAVAMGIGRKRQGSGVLDTVSLRLYVPNGCKRQHRRGVQFIDTRLPYDHDEAGRELTVETDVDECGPQRLHGDLDPAAVHTRIPGGVSLAGANAGTLGGWAWDDERARPVLLSAGHVLGTQVGHIVSQPARLDRMGYRERVVGKVDRVTQLRPSGSNRIDAATALVSRRSYERFDVLRVGPAIMAVGEPVMDMPVEKYGKTTRLTQGTVVDEVWWGDFQHPTGGVIEFGECMRIELAGKTPWAAPGDSGALVFGAADPVTGLKPAIGLHIGADETNPAYGIACRMTNVFSALHLRAIPDGMVHRAFAESAARDREGVVRGLWGTLGQHLRNGPGGIEVLSLLDRHRATVTSAIMRSQALQGHLAALVGALFRNVTAIEDVLVRPLSASAVDAATSLLSALRPRVDAAARAACASLGRRLSGGGGKSLETLLELSTAIFLDVTPTAPALDLDQRKQLYREYAERFGSELRHRFEAHAIAVGRAPGRNGLPADVALIFYTNPDRADEVRARLPETLEWERPGLPTIEIRTSVRAERPPKLTRRR